MKDIDKLIEWKDSVDKRMTSMEQAFMDLRKNFDTLQKAVLGKVAEYDRNMKNVGSDVKAMDSIFQKILPTLTENVNELGRLTKKTRTKK